MLTRLMLTRRKVLEMATAVVPSTSVLDQPHAAAPAREKPLRFGVVADPQYAPVAPAMNRYYANSLWKLSEAIEIFNAEADLSFVVTLGDIIDRHWESYGHILPIYDRLRHPKLFVLGNHDFEVGPDYLMSVPRALGLERRYYDFAVGGTRFIVIDGNDVSLFAHPKDSPRYKLAVETLQAMKDRGEPNAREWNGGLGEEQYAWLEQTMDRAEAAGETIIILGHYPVYPKTKLSMWGAERFVKLATARSSFLAYLNGHDHAGNYGVFASKHFVNFKGMVETATETAYALVTLHQDRIEVQGFGTEPCRRLAV
jgi:3',5'-cyclic AMP phosphodiesterase CpdA